MDWRPLSEYPTPDKWETYGDKVLLHDGKTCYTGMGIYDTCSDEYEDGTPVFEKWVTSGCCGHEIKALVWAPLPEYKV